jgi:hypothetical protein
MVLAPPPIQTTVVAVSPQRQHRPFRDGRMWLGDRVHVTIKDAQLPESVVLTGRVCFTVSLFHSTRCNRFQFGRNVLKTVGFTVEYNANAVVRWYQRDKLLATRSMRIVGGD